jgi:lysophospholipase L1-like esterase
MTVKRFWLSATLILIAGIMAACGPNETSTQDYRLTGRYVETETGGHQMGWPASGAEILFEGTELTVSLTDGGNGIMDVFVNGEESALKLKAGTHDYVLVDSEKTARFKVVLSRRTEVFDTGLFTLEAIETNGRFLPQSEPSRKMLFIGDSITAGFGVRGDSKDCQYNPTTNAPHQAYAALTAKGFEAAFQLIAISGRGVVHNWDGNPAPVMPMQIDYALPDEGGVWDHQKFIPDVVVTTLGTNDWSVINPGQDKFRSGYYDMLSNLRERFPNAYIIAVNGPLLDGEKGAAIQDGIDWAMAKLSDPKISTLNVGLAKRGLIWSCNYHPGRDSMKLMANQLGAHLADTIGWSFNKLERPEIKEPVILPPANMLPGGKAHFEQRMTEIIKQPALKGGVLFAGDSITEAWQWHKDSLPPSISEAMSNHGIGWDIAEGLQARLPEILRHDPDQIVIMIGTNDIGYNHSAEKVGGHVGDIIAVLQAKKPNTQIYLQSVLPRESDAMAKVRAYNSAYKEIARDMAVTFIDLTESFAAPDGTLRPDVTEDGLHLTAKGYQIWADILSQELKRPSEKY